MLIAESGNAEPFSAQLSAFFVLPLLLPLLSVALGTSHAATVSSAAAATRCQYLRDVSELIVCIFPVPGGAMAHAW